MFDVKIFRALSTYQFTDRLLFRNIMEFNTFARTVGTNLLLTYRVNSGTVFFIGYDDRYQQGNLIFDDTDDLDPLFFTTDLERPTGPSSPRCRICSGSKDPDGHRCAFPAADHRSRFTPLPFGVSSR